MNSALEKTNGAYALAKISGLKYCEFLNKQYGTDYISVMPTNLYGPNDNYHPTHSHVMSALIRRFHEAKEQGLESVTCWGDGSPRKLLDVSKATKFGWTYKTELKDGIKLAYEDFLHNPMRAER